MATGKVIIAVPSYSSLTIVLTITGGAVFYGDFDSLSTNATVNFGAGVSIVAVGIVLLSVLQWCRQLRQRKFLKENRGSMREPLHSKGGYDGGSDLHAGSSVGESVTLDGTSSFGDGASTYGDGASSTGELHGARGGDSDSDVESLRSTPAAA